MKQNHLILNFLSEFFKLELTGVKRASAHLKLSVFKSALVAF